MSLTSPKVVLCSLMVIGVLTWGTSWLPAPAIAGDEEVEGQVVILQTDAVSAPEPATLVAFLAEGEGDGPRRSPEAEAGTRRSPEAEAGRRRSPEAEAGPRRSPEAEAGIRRSAEAESRPRRSAEGEGKRALGEFRPQTDREAALYRMILQLQRQVAQLRRELDALASTRERTSARDSDAPVRTGSRDPEQAPSRDPAYRKSERIFQTYDKDGNDQVSFAEFLAMREGADDPRVRAQAQESFKQVDRDGDGHVSFEEFLAASRRRHEGDRPRYGGDRPRDGGGERGGPRDGEGGVNRGPRDNDSGIQDRG